MTASVFFDYVPPALPVFGPTKVLKLPVFAFCILDLMIGVCFPCAGFIVLVKSTLAF